MQLKQLLSSELPYEEDWEDESIISNGTPESTDYSSTVHSNETSPATSLSAESLNKVCNAYYILSMGFSHFWYQASHLALYYLYLV